MRCTCMLSATRVHAAACGLKTPEPRYPGPRKHAPLIAFTSVPEWPPLHSHQGLVPPPPPPPPTGNGKSNSTHMITSGRIDTVTTTELVGMAIAGFAAGLVGIALALWVRRLECTRTLLSASKSWKVSDEAYVQR